MKNKTKNIIKGIIIGVGIVAILTHFMVNAATVLFPYQGGTGSGNTPSTGDLLIGSSTGVYDQLSTSTTGYVLTVTSTEPYVAWEAVTGSASAGGSDTQIQYNNGGVLSGTSDLTYSSSTNTFSMTTTTFSNNVTGVDPILESHLSTKRYVDRQVVSLGSNFYALGDDSGISNDIDGGNYLLTTSTASAGVEQSISTTVTADGQYIAGWIAPEEGSPPTLIAGVYDFQLFAEKTAGTKDLEVYWTLVERKNDGTEIAIGTSSPTRNIIGKDSYDPFLVLSENYDIATTSRVVGKVYANIGASGVNPELTLYYEGDSDSHWSIPQNRETLEDQFVQINSASTTNWDTAYSWGDHALVGYITSADIWGQDLYATSTVEFENIGINTSATTSTLSVVGDMEVHGTSTFYGETGVITFKDGAFRPFFGSDDLISLGASGADWKELYVSGTSTLGVISSGTWNGTAIDFSDYTNATGGRSINLNGDAIDADSELYTDTKCIWFENPTADDDFKSIWRSSQAITFTKIWAESDQTVNFDLQEDDGTPADILGTDLSPAAGTASSTTFSDASFAADSRLDLAITSVSGTPTWLSACWTYTKDD